MSCCCCRKKSGGRRSIGLKLMDVSGFFLRGKCRKYGASFAHQALHVSIMKVYTRRRAAPHFFFFLRLFGWKKKRVALAFSDERSVSILEAIKRIRTLGWTDGGGKKKIKKSRKRKILLLYNFLNVLVNIAVILASRGLEMAATTRVIYKNVHGKWPGWTGVTFYVFF